MKHLTNISGASFCCNSIVLTALVAALFLSGIFSSCKGYLSEGVDEFSSGEPACLTVLLESDATKSTLSQTEAEDNAVVTVDLFVFRETEAASVDHHSLDVYKRFTGAELDAISITTTTGPKLIYALINSHYADFKGVKNVTQFESLLSQLKNEELGNFTMFGSVQEQLTAANTVSIPITRFISRVDVTSVKTSFTGTPYEGMSLSNCKLYLVNVHGARHIHDNGVPATPVIYNNKKLVSADCASTAMEGMLMDDIAGTIGGTAYTTAHHLYTYSNETEDLAEATKLVLQADLDGTTYYYPIPVNQADYGYEGGPEPAGVVRNSVYTYTITVSKPGSTDPNTPIVPGVVDLTFTVTPWSVAPTFDKTF